VRLEFSAEIAVLRMEAGKANAISAAFLDRFEQLLREVDTSGARGVVLTGYDRFFCAGLALPSLIAVDRAGMRAFVVRFSDFMEHLCVYPRPLVAAINGHAIAGGCVLALQCDYRVMIDGGALIGLNEIALGIGLPPAASESLRAVIAASSWEHLAERGHLMSPKEAQQAGLVDEVVVEDQVVARAIHLAGLLAERPAAAFAQIKGERRRPLLAAMRADRETRLERWLDTWFTDEARALINKAVARLQRSDRGSRR
jgi:enoyl-CoA hydratase